MTKTILTIASTLALTLPFTFTKNNISQLPVETNNIIIAPTGQYKMSKELYNSICPRFSDSRIEPEVIIGDFIAPLHCKESNCGLGVYTKQADSNEERCSYCSAVKPAIY